jgi:hypothetical protein
MPSSPPRNPRWHRFIGDAWESLEDPTFTSEFQPPLSLAIAVAASPCSTTPGAANAAVAASSGASGAQEVDYLPQLLQLQEVMFHVCRAFVKLHDHDALIGVRHWASLCQLPRVAGEAASLLSLFPWLDAMALQARGYYEHAARMFRELLRFHCPCLNGGSTPDPLELSAIDLRAILSGISECYLALCDWHAMDEWLAELATLRAAYAHTPFHPQLRRRSCSCKRVYACSAV